MFTTMPLEMLGQEIGSPMQYMPPKTTTTTTTTTTTKIKATFEVEEQAGIEDAHAIEQ